MLFEEAHVHVQVEWEEYWWEASDWAGMKELGAEKSGCSADGAAWRETWREAIAFDPFTGEPTVERTAHKWAHDAKVSWREIDGKEKNKPFGMILLVSMVVPSF